MISIFDIALARACRSDPSHERPLSHSSRVIIKGERPESPTSLSSSVSFSFLKNHTSEQSRLESISTCLEVDDTLTLVSTSWIHYSHLLAEEIRKFLKRLPTLHNTASHCALETGIAYAADSNLPSLGGK